MRISFDVPEGILQSLLDPVAIPLMARVRYDLPAPEQIADVGQVLHEEMIASGMRGAVRRGMRIAIGVGSRGIDRVAEVTAALVGELRALGAEPFIIPTMGSHGGATAEGQRAVLEHLGVTPERVGAPIESQMETTLLGHTAERAPVLIDRLALAADGIVFVARVKPHTAYHGTYESGLAKMLAIGMGKQAGAASTHARGFGQMARMVPAMAEVVLQRAPVLFGVALVENAYDRIFELRVVPAARIMAEEPELLQKARAAMPRIPYEQLDVLVIDEIGKNISGDGADPNITGRFPTPYASGGPAVTRQVVLDLTNASYGNANGVGTADFTTVRLAGKMRLEDTYPNALTSTIPQPVALPMVLPSDRLAIAAAILTCNAVDREPRIMRIANTLKLAEFQISPALLADARSDDAQSVAEEPLPLAFDGDGNLRDLGGAWPEPAGTIPAQQHDAW
jgi:hypothetical protein